MEVAVDRSASFDRRWSLENRTRCIEMDFVFAKVYNNNNNNDPKLICLFGEIVVYMIHTLWGGG
jgi:hypothetical protein